MRDFGLLLLAAAFTASPALLAQDLNGFDAFAEQSMKDFHAPGLAVGVVRNGKVILAKGYGFRDVEKKLPVTSKTLFAIGSITKSFNVTTMGTLVDEGKLDWDKPVRNYLPEFRMYDSVATEQMTPRDLVTHRSGLPRHDLVWYTADFTRKDLVERLQYLEPNKPFRSTYQYNNLMFMTAGYLEEHILGVTWEEAVRQRVLQPLGMVGTTFSTAESQKSPDFAEPYNKDYKTQEVFHIPFHELPGIGPAGEINSNVDDMCRYLIFHLNKGKIDGKQIVSENNVVQMQSPQMAVQGAPQYPELSESSYGMGFAISSYRGHKIVEHGGAIDGFIASFAFLPQDQIGVVVFANLGQTALPSAISYGVIDRLLKLDPAPWGRRYLETERKVLEGQEQARQKGYTGQRTGTHPSHELKEYAGEYAHPGYGNVTISVNDAHGGQPLKLALNNITRPLDHFHYDTFSVPANSKDEFEKLKVSFVTDLKGDVSSVTMPLEPNVKEIVFTRVPEKRMREKSFLESFIGAYDLYGRTLTVVAEGDHALAMVLPGRPKIELLPNHGTMFDLKGLAGQSIEFKGTEAVLYSPGDVSIIKRK